MTYITYTISHKYTIQAAKDDSQINTVKCKTMKNINNKLLNREVAENNGSFRLEFKPIQSGEGTCEAVRTSPRLQTLNWLITESHYITRHLYIYYFIYLFIEDYLAH
jgi:hypothetical protein